MFNSRRSQAALEFLMTYGWAILVVLIVISALAYFGVLNPQRMLPNRCTLPTGLNCKDYVVKAGTPGSITINLLNGMGSGILITGMTATAESGNPIGSCTYTPPAAGWGGISDVLHLSNGGAVDVTMECADIDENLASPDRKFRWNLEISYYAEDSSAAYTKTVAGELLTTVEK